PRNSSRSPSSKLLIQLFIFSNRYCLKERFFFAPSSERFSEPSSSVVIFNTAVILLSDLLFPKTSISLPESLTASAFHLSFTHSIPHYRLDPSRDFCASGL